MIDRFGTLAGTETLLILGSGVCFINLTTGNASSICEAQSWRSRERSKRSKRRKRLPHMHRPPTARWWLCSHRHSLGRHSIPNQFLKTWARGVVLLYSSLPLLPGRRFPKLACNEFKHKCVVGTPDAVEAFEALETETVVSRDFAQWWMMFWIQIAIPRSRWGRIPRGWGCYRSAAFAQSWRVSLTFAKPSQHGRSGQKRVIWVVLSDRMVCLQTWRLTSRTIVSSII